MLAVVAAVAALAAWPLRAQGPVNDKSDQDAISRIRQEGLQRSQVMETTSYLSDVFGARLTGSSNIRDAAQWTEQRMKAWGLSNVHVETWPFGRGWENHRFAAVVVTPRPFPLIGFPKAWTPGTNGPVTGEAVLAVIQADGDFDTFKGKLRGKFVLTTPMRDVPAHFDPLGHRLTDAELATLATPPPARGRGNGGTNPAQQQAFARRRTQFWLDEGAAAVIDPGRGDGGTFFVQAGGSQDPGSPPVPPQVRS